MAKGDMFLKLESARQGPIKGEANDKAHPNEIDVIGWPSGMRAQTAVSTGGASGKAPLRELSIIKNRERPSPGWMSEIRHAEPIEQRLLTRIEAGRLALA